MPATDAELMAQHAAGDREAFQQIVARHRDRLWGVALRTLGEPEDAADALQDGLLSAYRAAGGFRGEAAVTTWLHRIVVNACLDVARRRRSRPTAPLEEALAAEHGPVAPDETGRSETTEVVLRALRELPVEQAAAVVLVDMEGYPVADVADILQVPVGTVKSRCARARARLAVSLASLLEGNPQPGQTVKPDVTSPRPEAGG